MKRPVDIISKTKHSLVHIGSLDSFDLTEGGIAAAANIMKYFETKDKEFLEQAVMAYDKLIPAENFGGEYSALRWICNLLRAPSQEDVRSFFDDPTVESWYEFLKRNEFEKLKEYINYKYHFLPLSHDTEEGRETGRTLRFLEDFILFSNPDRERWEKTESILKQLRIIEGMSMADVGCGSGYFTFKFADMVGPKGKIYGIEINPLHLDYLRGYIEKQGIANVEIVESASDGIGLPQDTRVDIVFSCSLFHVLYAVFSEDDRRRFMESIYNALNPGGALVVMDNDLVEDGDLPYHGPYIAKDLLVSQMYHYGFKLQKVVQETKQRYALAFEKSDAGGAAEPGIDDRTDIAGGAEPVLDDRTDIAGGIITAMTGVSLVKNALADATPVVKYTENGRRAAELFLRALNDKTEESIGAAIAAYDEIIPNERIGDEYTAFVWFCEYLRADEREGELMTSDLQDREYHNYFAGDDYALLKRYVAMRYELGEFARRKAGESDGGGVQKADDAGGGGATGETGIGENVASDDGGGQTESANMLGDGSRDDMIQLNEYMSFNNPARERWEKTSLMLDMIDIKPGDIVADVGCGSGYFTYKFAKMTGPSGKVYATELNKAALSYVETMRDRYDMNIVPVVSALNDVKLPEGIFDKVFMCSMYHAVYVSTIEFVKDAFIDSIRKALKDGGKLIVVDNDVKRDGVPEYYGSAIDKRLVISQLMHYGFRLVDENQFIPQRYILIFEKD